MKILTLFGLMGILSSAVAQDDPPALDEGAPPPPLPPKIQDEQLDTTVEIRREEDKLIEEYSINGQIYMVKVTPDKGPAYYLLDEDGDGSLEPIGDDDALDPVKPVYWKIKEW